MQLPQIMNQQQALELARDHPQNHIKIGVFDIDGILRGKYISKEKFCHALDKGLGFCDVVLGWDSADQLYDNVNFTGWHSGYPDAAIRVLPETCRRIPFEDNALFFICEFTHGAEAICPRAVLRRVIDKAHAMGFKPFAALEYEFFLFAETPDSLREKSFRHLKPITPGYFGYSVLRSSVMAEFYHELLATCDAMNIPIEGLHTENGPGVVEAAISVDDALSAGDKASLFKTFTKVVAQRRGWMATFMAKWSNNYPGQSGHIHVSLQNKSGKNVFYDAAATFQMSSVMQQFVAGQLALMPEWLALVAPTVNSYTRLIPGFWAPTVASWGIQNRTCALRVIPGSDAAQRVEYRIAGADCNPYLGLAAAIASGLHGIEQQMKLGDAVQGNAYNQQFTAKQQIPRTLWEAAQRFKNSVVAREWFGDEFVDHFAATREWEEREARKHISDWQLARYFEII